jgi:hypothetical protein
MELRGKNALVLGGYGLVGTAVCYARKRGVLGEYATRLRLARNSKALFLKRSV